MTSLTSRQLDILQRITSLERILPEKTCSLLPLSIKQKTRSTGIHVADGSTESRLGALLKEQGVHGFAFLRVPLDYYDRPYEARRDLLGAASVDHLCKSIVMVNTQAGEDIVDCSNPNNSKYYVVVLQYTARLNAEKVRQFLHSLNGGQIAKKRFNMRLAPEEDSDLLTGFEHNAVTPVGMKTKIPVILSDAIVRLIPEFFWMGGGEVDLKLGMSVSDFVRSFQPFIADCTH